jgi:hypothetical protein
VSGRTRWTRSSGLQRSWTATRCPPPVELSPASKPAARPRRNGHAPSRALAPVLRSRPGRVAASRSEIAERGTLVIGLIRELEPVSFRDLAARVEFGSGALTTVLTKLREANVIQASHRNRHARWSLTETLDRQIAERNGTRGAHGAELGRCRDDVLQTIRSEPGEWSEQRIADSGAWDREQVADACGVLLVDGLVQLCPDGTYVPLAGAVTA